MTFCSGKRAVRAGLCLQFHPSTMKKAIQKLIAVFAKIDEHLNKNVVKVGIIIR